HRGGQRALERDAVAPDRVQGGLRQQFAMLLQCDDAGVDLLVPQAEAHRVEHVQGGIHDLRADAVAADDRNRLAHVGGFRTKTRRAWARRGMTSDRRQLCPKAGPRPKPTKVPGGPAGRQPASCACSAGASPAAASPPCSSRSRKSTARRRWGMTMLPPTTSPTENASKNSSRVTPA